MYCRTHETRKDIVKNYYVLPIEHNIIINGMTIKADDGEILQNEYYKFILIKDNQIIDTIICGHYVANDFAKLIHKSLPPVFNIFDNELINNEEYLNYNYNKKNVIWDKRNKQLYNAIRILLLYKNDLKPNTPIYKIYNDVILNKDKFKIGNLKGYNTILEKYKLNLRTILEKISQNNQNRRIRRFNFDLLQNVLTENNIKSNI